MDVVQAPRREETPLEAHAVPPDSRRHAAEPAAVMLLEERSLAGRAPGRERPFVPLVLEHDELAARVSLLREPIGIDEAALVVRGMIVDRLEQRGAVVLGDRAPAESLA
jgi:hypothetical protein